MLLDELPDLALHRICLKLEFEDIKSLQETSQKLFHHIRGNRVYYSKYPVRKLKLRIKRDGRRIVKVLKEDHFRIRETLTGSVSDAIKWLNPERLISYDHDELANMHPKWWNEITKIKLYDIVDYQRYLPYLDRCTNISFRRYDRMNLSEILASMQTKNLKSLSLISIDQLNFTDEDFRTIGRLSKQMKYLNLGDLNAFSNISSDAILDMIEIGSFADYALIKLARFQDDMIKCIKRRRWVTKYNHAGGGIIDIKMSNGRSVWIQKWNTVEIEDSEKDSSDSDSESDSSDSDSDSENDSSDLDSDSDSDSHPGVDYVSDSDPISNSSDSSD